MQYKLFQNPEVIDVTAPPVKVKKTIDPKDIILGIAGILIITMGIMWFLSSRQVEKLREEKYILTQKLLIEQEKEKERITVESKKTDLRIEAIEQRRTKNLENEKTINSMPSLDVRAAEEFFAEYEPTSTND